jgi:glycosyltransferase involved in cell wall biosynthesis
MVTLLDGARSHKAFAWELILRMREALSGYGPEVVFVPGWSDKGALIALEWCMSCGRPAVVMSESTALDVLRTAWREAIKKKVVALFSAALVGGSAHTEYMTALGMPRARVFMGYDVVDDAYFAAGAEQVRNHASGVRQRLGLPARYFLASARFIGKKNLLRLLQAYARYRSLAARAEVGPPKSGIWSLVLLGDGPLRASILDLRSSLGLDGCVQLPGFKQYDELPAYYGLADAFVHASTTEQWGLVVNEAMASGLPVLVSKRCGCAPDLVREGVNGFTFDPFNVEEMAGAMFRVWQMDNGELKRMGDASRRIIADWGPERFADGLKQAAECALKVGPKRAGLFDRLLLKALLFR